MNGGDSPGAFHDKLVKHMLVLHKQLPAAKTDHEKEVIQRQIHAADKRIDQLVERLDAILR